MNTTRHRMRRCHSDEKVQDYTQRGWWHPFTLLELFDGHVGQRPDEAALSDPPNLPALTGLGAEQLTWGGLHGRVERIAATLHGAGIGQGDVVAVLLPNSVALTATLMALWRLGAIAAPMPASYRRHELTRIVESSAAVAVVTVDRLSDRSPAAEALNMLADIPSLETVFSVGPEHREGTSPLDAESVSIASVQHYRAHVGDLKYTVNDCITICFTSGTEAAPKGIPRCHADWIAVGMGVQDGLATDRNSVILNPFPMVNMAGFATSFLPWLLGGGHLVLHQPLDLKVFLAQIQHHRVTHTIMAPAMLTMLLQREDIRAACDLSTLRRVGSGGAPLPPGVVRDWQNLMGVEVLNFFGSNEGVCLLGAPVDIPDPLVRAEYLPNYGAEGVSWATGLARNTRVKLVDPVSGAVASRPGERGELRLSGPTVFAGYLEGTAPSSPFDDDGYLCSGDVFEIAGANGEYFRFVDRLKEIIIRGGMNIAPAEIEGILLDHPAVRDVAIVGYPDEVMGEKCCAVVVPLPGVSISLADVVAFLRASDIASFKLPERLVLVDGLPRNPVGKLLRRELRDTVLVALPGTDQGPRR